MGGVYTPGRVAQPFDLAGRTPRWAAVRSHRGILPWSRANTSAASPPALAKNARTGRAQSCNLEKESKSKGGHTPIPLPVAAVHNGGFLGSERGEDIVTRGRSKPICIYCGKREGTTKDHVPPKGLFPVPRPNMVTVPCCEQCRKGQSLDDEYFVRMIAMSRDANPAAAFARDAVHRTFTKAHKIGFTRALLKSIAESPVHTPASLLLGPCNNI